MGLGLTGDVPALVTATSRDLPAARLLQIRRFLDAAFDGAFTDHDWAHALGGWHVLAVQGEALLAHAAVVERRLEVDGRPLRTGYVEAVATAAAHRRKGHGSAVLRGVGEVVRRRFQLGALSTDHPAFYERCGWEVWRGPTFVRRGGVLVRSADEDGGVLVLQVGDTADVDLGAPIACEARLGDDW